MSGGLPAVRSLKTLVPKKAEGQHIRLLSVTRVQMLGLEMLEFQLIFPCSSHCPFYSMGTKACLSCFSSILNVWHTKVFA